MNAGTLIDYAQQRAGRVDSGYRTRTLNFLNEAMERWAIARPWRSLKRTVDLITDGTRNLVFPDYVAHVVWLLDKSNTNVINYQERWDRDNPGTYLADTSGRSDFWREQEVVPVYRQPTAAAQIAFTSTSSGESFAVHIAGILSDTAASGTAGAEYMGEEICTASGGTCVSTNIFKNILSVGKTGLTTGYVSGTAGGTELCKMAPNRYSAKYRKVELIAIPTANTEIRAGVILEPPRLTDEAHVPHSSVNNEFLIWYAAGLIHKAQGDTQIGEICMNRAMRIMAQDDQHEKTAGDQDWNAAPDPLYWQSEDSWP